MAVALEVLYGVDTGLRLDRLTAAAQLVASLAWTALPPNVPVIWRNSFTHESGLIVGGVLKEPLTGEPYPPELVGQTRRIVLGKESGLESIRHALAALDRAADDHPVAALLAAVKSRAGALERSLTNEEFAALVSELAIPRRDAR